MDDNFRELDGEARVRAACTIGNHDLAATLGLELYGREIFSFILARSPSYDEGSDIFSQFSEDLWKSLPAFEWRSSLRTWAYRLARQAAFQHKRREKRHANAAPLSQLSRLSAAVEQVRSATREHLRTETKTRFQALREQMSPEDQTLLILRVDRQMSWRDLATVMLPNNEPSTEETLKREAARLRKRFQIAKEELRAMADRAGLFSDATR